MAYSLNLGKLLSDITGPKGLAALTEEIHKIRGEVDRLKNSVQPQAEKKLKAIQVRLTGLRNKWEKRQTKLEKEFDRTLSTVKRVAKDAEQKIQKALRRSSSKRKTTTKKASSRTTKTTKKRAKTTRKTSRRS